MAETKAKKLGRQLKLPTISTIFPVKRNPLHESPVVKEKCQIIKEFSSMSDEHYSAIADIYLFTAYFHPFVDELDKYVSLCHAMQLFFVIDDHSECEWGDVARNNKAADLIWTQVDQCFERLLDGTNRISMAGWKPYIVALYICFEEIFKNCTKAQKKRIAKEYQRWGVGNKLEGETINSGKGFKSIEEYLEVRKLSIGAIPVFSLIEYADEIQLSDEEWQSMTKYMEHAAFCVVLANDYQSLEKEMIEQKDELHKMTNAVWLIKMWDNCSIDEALKKIVVVINDYEEKTHRLQKELLDAPNVSEDMKKAVDRVQYVIGGNLTAGLILRRFCEVSEIDE